MRQLLPSAVVAAVAAVVMPAELHGHPLAAAVVMPTELHGHPLAAAAVVLRLAVPASRPIAVRLVEFVVAAALPVLQLVVAAALQVLQIVSAAGRLIPAFGGGPGLPRRQRQACWRGVTAL